MFGQTSITHNTVSGRGTKVDIPFLLIPEDFTGFLHKYGGPPIEVVDEFFSAYYIDRQSILDGDISTEPILLPVKVDISPR